MNKQTIADIDIAGKQLLIRADLNVPLEKGKVGDDTRIVAALPTIRYALANGATAIVCSHLGRPKGKPDPKYSLKPVAERLAQLLDCQVHIAPDCIGPEVELMAASIPRSDVLLLENLRFMRRKRPTIQSLRSRWPRWQTFMLTMHLALRIAPTLRQLA